MTELVLSIFRVNGRLLRVGDEFTRDLGLTSARWQVMGAVETSPRTVAEIARRFEATRQGVLWVVTGLVKDELLELIDNPDHKRAKLVRFTSRGQRVFNEVQTRQITWVNRLATSFTLGEIRKSIDLLERVAHEAAE